MSKLKKKLYMVYKADDEYWQYYDTISDAVSDNGDGTEVFEAPLKSIGHYKNMNKVKKLTTKQVKQLSEGED